MSFRSGNQSWTPCRVSPRQLAGRCFPASQAGPQPPEVYWNNLLAHPAATNPEAAGRNWRPSEGEGNCLPVLHLVWHFLSACKAKSWWAARGNLFSPPQMGGDCVEESNGFFFIGNSINIPWESICFFDKCLSPLYEEIELHKIYFYLGPSSRLWIWKFWFIFSSISREECSLKYLADFPRFFPQRNSIVLH